MYCPYDMNGHLTDCRVHIPTCLRVTLLSLHFFPAIDKRQKREGRRQMQMQMSNCDLRWHEGTVHGNLPCASVATTPLPALEFEVIWMPKPPDPRPPLFSVDPSGAPMMYVLVACLKRADGKKTGGSIESISCYLPTYLTESHLTSGN